MTEKCPYCGKEFTNTRALGSHVHYTHERDSQPPKSAPSSRTEQERERLRSLLEGCLRGTALRVPKSIEKVEQAISEIPPGVSPVLDQYRNGFSCALSKEKLLSEVEKLLERKETE